MAGRKSKTTVEYFLHEVNSSIPLEIIERQYGPEGYTVYYKLREVLGRSEGHFFNLSDEINLEWFISFCGVKAISVTEILQKLAKLNVIDRELWENRILWSSEFVESLEPVYSKRTNNLPSKPSLEYIFKGKNKIKAISEPEKAISEPENAISGNGNTTTNYTNLTIDTQLKENNENSDFPSLEKKKESIDFDVIIEKFNSSCQHLPQVQKLTDKRKKSIRARISEHGVDLLEKVFELAGASSFLNGTNQRGWVASFDWILTPENFIKILEGTYSDKAKLSINSNGQQFERVSKSLIGNTKPSVVNQAQQALEDAKKLLKY